MNTNPHSSLPSQATDTAGGVAPPAPPAPIHDANGWMPIDTAPKDGTRVLLWVPELGGTFAAPFEHGLWQVGIWTGRPPAPSHWQPLPKPPVQS